MPVTIPNPTLSNPASKTEVEDNFSALADKFNAGIVDDDISSTAAIQTSKLASRDYEFLISLDLVHPNASVNAISQSLQAATTQPSLVRAFPGTSADGTYTVLSGAWYCTDVGDETTDFRVELGYFNAGVWTVVTTIATVNNMPGTGGADTEGQGAMTITGATLTLHASTQYYIGVVFPNALGTGFMNGSYGAAYTSELFGVGLKLRRTLGLRGT